MSEQFYPEPNYTQVPNLLLDEQMMDMTEAELKIVLFAVRRIIGWHRTKPEPISKRQFKIGTGLSDAAVKFGIERAVERGVLIIAKLATSRSSTYYTLRIEEGSKIQAPEIYTPELDSGGQNLDPQVLKEKVFKEKSSAAADQIAEKKPRKRSWRDDYFDALTDHAGIGIRSGMTVPSAAFKTKIITQLKAENIEAGQIKELYQHVANLAVAGKWGAWTVQVLPNYAADCLAALTMKQQRRATQTDNSRELPTWAAHNTFAAQDAEED